MVFGPQGPSNPTVTAVSRTEVIVSWEPPGQFLLTRLRCYEVYINASTKPTYSGTQAFCHLRGLKPDCQYHFKVQMVLKSEAVTDKATLNSKGGASRHYSANLQPPSSMHRRRRQAHDRPHVNGKSHLMKASLIGTTVVRITRSGKRPRPHRVAPIAACNSPDGSAYQQSLLLDKAATHPTTDSKSSRADQLERLLSCTQRVKESTPHGDESNTGKPHCHGQFLCKEERNCVKRATKKNVELGQRIASTSYNDHMPRSLMPLMQGGGIVGTAELQSCISHALKRSNRHMAFYPFLLNNRKKVPLCRFLLQNPQLAAKESTSKLFHPIGLFRMSEIGDTQSCLIH